MTTVRCYHMNCKFNSGFQPTEDQVDHTCTLGEIEVHRKFGDWTVAYCSTKEESE